MDEKERTDSLNHHRSERNQTHNKFFHGWNIDPHDIAHEGPGGGNGYEEKEGEIVVHKRDIAEFRDDKSSR